MSLGVKKLQHESMTANCYRVPYSSSKGQQEIEYSLFDNLMNLRGSVAAGLGGAESPLSFVSVFSSPGHIPLF